MRCNDHIKLMHHYLDGDLTKEDEKILRTHLEQCTSCQNHFHELSRTVTLIQSTEQVAAPADFTKKVMDHLPEEKKHIKYRRWFQRHPFGIAVGLLFVFIIGSLVSDWKEDHELVVSKQEDLMIRGDTVIVPEDVTVTGDLVVKNGDLQIKGTVDGDVTLINGELIAEEGMLASMGEITGDLNQVDQIFKWIWYQLVRSFESIVTFE